MDDKERITQAQLNILIISSAVTLIMVFLLGLVIGKNMNLPERSHSPKMTARQALQNGLTPEKNPEIDALPTRSAPSSNQPHIPDEGLQLYETAEERTPTPDAGRTTTVEPFVPIQTPTPDRPNRSDVSAGTAASPTQQADFYALADEGFDTAYAVQMSSVANRAYAENSVTQLVSKNYPAYISKIQFSTGRVHYRVRVGPYVHREAAESINRRLSDELKVTPLVMELSNGAL